jgi:hypothetical protein
MQKKGREQDIDYEIGALLRPGIMGGAVALGDM